jgi:hypothetical protein
MCRQVKTAYSDFFRGESNASKIKDVDNKAKAYGKIMRYQGVLDEDD